MSRHFYLRPGRGDFPVGPDDKAGALYSHIGLSIHRFFDPDAEMLADVGAVIGTEFDGQAVLCTKLRLFGGGILGNADDNSIGGLEFIQQPGEGHGLFRASAGVGAWKEEHDHIFAGIFSH